MKRRTLLGLPPNPRMQPTGRSGADFRSGKPSVGALWNVGLCGAGLKACS
jgi:hypothetical protein